jgi:hypothetical protein
MSMSRSFWRTLLALAAIAALLGVSACGGDDDESGDTGGTPAQTEESGGGGAENVTEQLFAGTALDNIKDPAATWTTWIRARRTTRTRSGS